MTTETPAPPISRDNADWLKLKLWLGARIRKLQGELESTAPEDERQHYITRGRIAELRGFLAGVEPTPLIEAEQLEEPDHYQGD